MESPVKILITWERGVSFLMNLSVQSCIFKHLQLLCYYVCLCSLTNTTSLYWMQFFFQRSEQKPFIEIHQTIVTLFSTHVCSFWVVAVLAKRDRENKSFIRPFSKLVFISNHKKDRLLIPKGNSRKWKWSTL